MQWLFASVILSLVVSSSSEPNYDFTADMSLSLTGNYSGIYTGTMSYSWANGYVTYNYTTFSRTERYWVPDQGFTAPCGTGRGCLDKNSIKSTVEAPNRVRFEISSSKCSSRQWGIPVPDCIDSLEFSECGRRITAFPFWGDQSCGYYDRIGATGYLVFINKCLNFTVTATPKPGFEVTTKRGYIAMYGGWDWRNGFCTACSQLVFTCTPLRSPVSSFATCPSGNSLSQADYPQPILWPSTTQYTKTDLGNGQFYWTLKAGASGIVTDLWTDGDLPSKAIYGDGRLYTFTNVRSLNLPAVTFPPNPKCKNPVDIAIVLDKYTGYKQFEYQRFIMFNLTKVFDIGPLNTQMSVNYVDNNKFYSVLPLQGGISQTSVNNSVLSLGCKTSYCGKHYGICGTGRTDLAVTINKAVDQLAKARDYSTKVIVIFFDGYLGDNDDGDHWDQGRYTVKYDTNAIDLALERAKSLDIVPVLVSVGRYTVLPFRRPKHLRIFNVTDYLTMMDNITEFAGYICSLSPAPCGACCGLCECGTCNTPQACPTSTGECYPSVPDSIGCCTRSEQPVCANDDANCGVGVCGKDNRCQLVYSCPPNNDCYDYTCNIGDCIQHYKGPTDPCIVSTCLIDPYGNFSIQNTPKCPTTNDACYQYTCDNGVCKKTAYNQPNITDCQYLVCDPLSGWQVIDIPCFDVPEKCIKGSCKNGQCVLEPQCHSYGCVQSSCVNGACVVSATTATCQTLPSDQQGCLKPKGCNVKTGDCIYEPCTFPQPCQIPTCLNGLCKSQNFNTGLDCQKCNLLCRNFPCVRQTCAPGGICVDTNICPDVTGMTTICNGSVYPPLCTYTPITNCSLLNQEGVDYVWDPVAIACVAVPVVCTPTIPGCSSARLVFDPVTKLNQCSEVLSCVGSGCTKETCVLDSTGTQGVCVQDPANCMGKDLCFDCPLGACTAEAIDCTSGDPCMVGSCSLQAGCYFAPLNCDDGDGCTEDSCVGGQCLHRMCDDGDNCTLDSCDFERRECVFVQRTCDDNNQCTADSCVPDAGCVHVNVSNGCQSNDPCVKSYCDPFLGCVEKSVACSTPPNGAACSFAYCNSSSGTAQCVQVNASCLYALIDPNYQAAIVGGAVGGAALIGIVIAVVVVVTASGGGVAYYVKNAMDDTSEILTVNENPAHVMYGRGGENPLSADLLS